jgi:hypothetical protein
MVTITAETKLFMEALRTLKRLLLSLKPNHPDYFDSIGAEVEIEARDVLVKADELGVAALAPGTWMEADLEPEVE